MPELLLLGAGGATEDTLQRAVYLLGPKLLRLDYAGGPDPVYLGTAPAGSAETAPVWTVQRITYDGGNVTALDVRGPMPWTARLTPTPPWETP